MKNVEVVVVIGRRQEWWREADGWRQRSGAGVVRRVSAEQLLSHLIPALARGISIEIKQKQAGLDP